MFYSWTSVDAFEVWHTQAKQYLGIPYPGRNARTGEIDEDAQWTEAYTNAVVVSATDIRAFVEDAIAQVLSDNLGVISSAPPAPPEE